MKISIIEPGKLAGNWVIHKKSVLGNTSDSFSCSVMATLDGLQNLRKFWENFSSTQRNIFHPTLHNFVKLCVAMVASNHISDSNKKKNM